MIKEISKQTKSMYIPSLWVVVREKVIACIYNKPVLKILIIRIIIINILHG